MTLPIPRRLADVQARQVEVGRIRLGTSRPKTSRAGKEYKEPVKLDRFRLTSRSETLIQQVALVYGGEPEPWQPDHGAQQWQVVIDKTSLQVIVPPNACSQYYEQWTNGRCSRRCDGLRELLEDQLCVCGPDPASKKQAGCKPTTRVSLMLADTPGMGVWRLESHGYNAAAELPGAVDLLTALGRHIPARLEMEERQAEVPDPRNADKTMISRFMVPVLHIDMTPAVALLGAPAAPALEARPAPALAAGPQPLALPATATPAEDTWDFNSLWRGIAQADTLDKLKQVSGHIQDNIGKLQQEQVDALRQAWQSRRALLADPPPSGNAAAPAGTAGPGSTSSSTSSPAPSSSPSPDRMALWNQVATLAGARQWSMSKLRELYGEWRGQPGELARATAAELEGFLPWLGSRHGS